RQDGHDVKGEDDGVRGHVPQDRPRGTGSHPWSFPLTFPATTPLLERDAERAALAQRLEGARAGHGGVTLVRGPAGIGKTALLAEARTLAANAGLRVLSARGSELEGSFAFGAVQQLFAHCVDELSGAAAHAAAAF